jgi:hypothetical protein
VVGFKEIYQGVCITVEDNGIGSKNLKKQYEAENVAQMDLLLLCKNFL